MKVTSIITRSNMNWTKCRNKTEVPVGHQKVEKNMEVVNQEYKYYMSTFGRKASLVKELSQTKLYSDYKSSNKSFFEFIKSVKATPGKVSEFLFGITKDEEASRKFISEINAEPKNADLNTKILLEKMGNSKNFKAWYYHQDGYQRAYERYFKKEVFENNNVSVDDMVKIAPNLIIEALKLKSLRTTGSQDFVIGNIPADIGTIEEFRTLTQKIRNSKLVKEFVKFRDFMEDLDAFAEKYPEAKANAVNPARFAKDFLKAKITAYRNEKDALKKRDLEQQVPFLKFMKETTINVGGKRYTYTPILRPYSTKLLFALQPQKTANKYFVTMEMFNNLEKTCKNSVDKENSAMRPDSPFLNAVFDYYLKLNGCENVPDVKFYDYASNAVVYPFIKGESLKPEGRTDNLGVIFENTALENELKSIADLNVFVTDCFFENFMKDSDTGKTLLVDNGHAKFSNALKPGVKFIHMNYADLYGRDFVTLDASINRAKETKFCVSNDAPY